jgi:DNA polymerase III subunit alpha
VVLPPDINQSFHEFAVMPGKNEIRFGLDAIKNVGHGAVDEILRAREAAGGQFESIGEYCQLVNCRIVNRKALESLIKSGAFDQFGERDLLVNNIDGILAAAQRIQKNINDGQVDLFGDGAKEAAAPQVNLEPGEPISLPQQLNWERELLGVYLSSHPLEDYKDILEARAVAIASLSRNLDGRILKVGGSINQVREITTKNGSKMAFVKIADLSGETELIVFPKTYAQNPDTWQPDKVIIAKGKVDFSRNDELKILVEEVVLINQEQVASFDKAKEPKLPEAVSLKQRLYIRMEDSHNQPKLLTLKEKLDGFAGETEVVLVTGEPSAKQVIKLPQTIELNEQSLRELASIFGSTNVVVK